MRESNNLPPGVTIELRLMRFLVALLFGVVMVMSAFMGDGIFAGPIRPSPGKITSECRGIADMARSE